MRLKEYKAAGCLKKRMTMFFRMSLQPKGRASRRRKWQQMLSSEGLVWEVKAGEGRLMSASYSAMSPF